MVAGAVFVLLFGAIALSIGLGEGRTQHNARVLGIEAKSFRVSPSTRADVSRVHLRIDTGEEKSVDAAGLIDALPADPAGVRVQVEMDGETVNSVTYNGHTYGSGAAVAKIVFAVIALLGGLALGFFGIRRLRAA
jgi:hypothetical protein